MGDTMGLMGSAQSGSDLSGHRSQETAFRKGVAAVLQIRTDPQVGRVAASRVIAGMTKNLSGWYRSVRKFVGDTMCLLLSCASSESAVSPAIDFSRPIPTASSICRFVYLFPKAFIESTAWLRVIARRGTEQRVMVIVPLRLKLASTISADGSQTRMLDWLLASERTDTFLRAEALMTALFRREVVSTNMADHAIHFSMQS